jgi:3-oxoadipate enol-lactonase
MEVTLNGTRIHYERSGEGFPVLFIHAGIADSRMWEPQAAAFSDRFDMIRADQRGFGDTVALLDHLNVDRAHVVGCSMGGTLALDLALEHPRRVEKLVLIAAGVSGSNLGASDTALFTDIEEADKAGDMDAVNRAEVRLWVDGPRRREGSAPATVRELVLDMNGRSLHTDWSAAENRPIEHPAITRLSEIAAPTLVIVGDQDLPHCIANADLITSKVAGSRKVIIENAAHLPSLERPEEFNRVLLDFLTG